MEDISVGKQNSYRGMSIGKVVDLPLSIRAYTLLDINYISTMVDYLKLYIYVFQPDPGVWPEKASRSWVNGQTGVEQG